ncbi:retrovirus-related pol polyprotein from transposon TNT 1-94 [Tanacetum coccineum]
MHLWRDRLKNSHKKLTCFIKKDDQPSSSGLNYDGSEVMMVMSAECDEGRALLDGNKECKIRGVGMSGKVKVILDSNVVLSGTQRDNCVYSLDDHVVFKDWKHLVEIESGMTVKKLRTNNDLEFFNRVFKPLCTESGIARHLSILYLHVRIERTTNATNTRQSKKELHGIFSTTSFTLKLLSNNDLKGTRTNHGFIRAFAKLFNQDVQAFKGTMYLNLDQLEKQLDKEEFQEIGSTAAGRVLATQFQKFIKSRSSLYDEDVIMARKYFLEYTQLEVQQLCNTLIQHMESVKKSINKRALHKREYDSRVNERQIRTESIEKDTSSRSGNDTHDNDAAIRPIYDEEPLAKVQLTAKCNVFSIGQQHTKQPEFNNEGWVDKDAEQCHDTRPLPAKLIDNQTIELSYQSLKFENICLKKTVAQFQKDVLRMEAHCVNLELKYQNQALKEGQHVAKLLKENETLKNYYKELYDSIKTTRAKTIENTTSLVAQNAEFKAQLQEKRFAIAALKNELRKLKGNNVDTKFAKPSILGKPVLQSLRNQYVVRQPTAFKSE